MTRGPYGRNDRLIKEKRHDVYLEKGKWPEPTLCIDCGAMFVKGRWAWQQLPPEAKACETICPACRRIADRFPAGYVWLKGSFYEYHQDEILRLVRNVEKQETRLHPLERIMAMTVENGNTLVTTTGLHLARRIGEALSKAYRGELSFRYADSEKSIRVNWER